MTWRGADLVAGVSAILLLIAGMAVAAPQRVVSINLCTDLLAMRLAAPGQLVAISRLTQDPAYSPDADTARGFPATDGLAEEVLQLKPDLVLAGTYTTPETAHLLRAFGIRVEAFAPATNLEEVREQLGRMGRLLDAEQTAGRELLGLQAAIENARTTIPDNRPVAIAYGPNGYSGAGNSLDNDILEAAGFRNLASQIGYSGFVHIPLERLVAGRPDAVLIGTPANTHSLAHNLLSHPALTRSGIPLVEAVNPDWTCGGPYTARAIRKLARLRESLFEHDDP